MTLKEQIAHQEPRQQGQVQTLVEMFVLPYLQQRVKELDRNGGVRAPGSGDKIQELELATKHFTF